jgi:hypothetical protein
MINRIYLLLVFLFFVSIQKIQAQKQVTLEVEPNPAIMETNKPLQLKVLAKDEDGNNLEETKTMYFPLELKGVKQNMIFTGGIKVDSLGVVTSDQPGDYDVIVMRTPGEGELFARTIHKIKVINQPVAKIETSNVPTSIFEGAIITLDLSIIDKGGTSVSGAKIDISSSDENVVKTDNLYNIYAINPGKATISIKAGEAVSKVDIEVRKNPVSRLEIMVNNESARTGDVLQFSSKAYNKGGKEISDAPAIYSVQGSADEAASGASAMIDRKGRFVAEKAGTYMVTVSSGKQTASKAVRVGPRDITQPVKMMGHGTVNTKHTSDLWVWEGVDGKDYAVTGTWGADGKAYFWEVTDPSNIILIDSVQVDARTVNDVKVSEDGKICVISREGASNRKNGIIILDVTNPRDVKILTEYTESLTGGVHNLYIYKNHVYALSNSQRYEIINIEDPSNPVRVGKFELGESTNRNIHDVWIEDGIAYSSNWSDGVVMVDIGNGIAGGSPENPVEISRSKVEGSANHAAFPYKSKDTGKFYVIAGDEIFPLAAMYSSNLEEVFAPAGYLHFMDFTDPDNPVEVARYEVPEAGSHNFWVEDDLLYIGYYNGGLRVVDISGDLMGDLYKQGREVASFIPYDADGFVPNAPFVWGAQPYKGYIFFSDYNSGLWSAQLEPVRPENTKIESR